jgi:inward rectifier potassium channel
MSSSAPPISREEIRDLGFGSVVSQEQQIRLLNRDGSFNVARRGYSFWEALSSYHELVTMSWPKFYALVLLVFLLANAIFGGLYLLCGPGSVVNQSTHIDATWKDIFFYSIQTISTIGSSTFVAVGVAGNTVQAIELLFGLMGFAVIAGLVFARFSRPTARILYSEKAVIAPYRGITAFEFRVANGRNNQMIEVNAKVLFTRFENVDGRPLRRYYLLPLERDNVTFFPLSWTVVHPIDDQSPIKGITPAEMAASNAEFLILMQGIDETFAQNVHSRSSYRGDEIVWNAKFADVFSGMKEKNLTVDMRKFSEVEKVPVVSS